MHKAIIKCESYDYTWKFDEFKFNKMVMYRKEILSNIDTYLDRYYSHSYIDFDRAYWRDGVSNLVFENNKVMTGQITLCEMDMNIEILKVGHNIYIEELNEYKEVLSVNVRPNGDVEYIINYMKKAFDNQEDVRIEEVDKWFKHNFPNYTSFNQLLSHKDDIRYSYKEYIDLHYHSASNYVTSFAEEFGYQSHFTVDSLFDEEPKEKINNHTITNDTTRYQQYTPPSTLLVLGAFVTVLFLIFLVLNLGN